MPKVGEVEEGHKRIGNDHHPGFEVDVRGLLLRVHVPVQSQAKAHSSSNSVRRVVLEVTLVLAIQTLFRGLRISNYLLTSSHMMVPGHMMMKAVVMLLVKTTYTTISRSVFFFPFI